MNLELLSMRPLRHFQYRCVWSHLSIWQLILKGFWLQFATLGFYSTLCASQTPESSETVTLTAKGHLKPFGESGTRLAVDVRTEFPEPLQFLTDYVAKSRPLKLSGVMRNSRAVRLWTDAYLMTLDVPEESLVQLETKKKENRSADTTAMHFHEFLKIYNETEHYMVDDVPPYLRPDVLVPCSLQCQELVEKGIAFALMWFSSGGTNSVIHTDAFENINCLFRGEKTFVMVDPAKHRDKIELDTRGAYSTIDVDSVDFNVYPGVAEMEFYHINVTAGDCLYIPYRWIHQVRSFNSNVAVNFWWDHHSALQLLQKSACKSTCDPGLTLDKIELRGYTDSLNDVNHIRDWLSDIIVNNPVNIDKLKEVFKRDFSKGALSSESEATLIEVRHVSLELNNLKSENFHSDMISRRRRDNLIFKLFQKLDADRDYLYTTEDTKHILEETWRDIQKDIALLESLMGEQMPGEDEEYVETEERKESVQAEERDEL